MRLPTFRLALLEPPAHALDGRPATGSSLLRPGLEAGHLHDDRVWWYPHPSSGSSNPARASAFM